MTLIGKVVTEEGTLHNKIFKIAKELKTNTIKYWEKVLWEFNGLSFEKIKEEWVDTEK